MDSARAHQVAGAYIRASGGQGWFDQVEHASRALLPDTDDWAVYQDPDRRDALVFATDGAALYGLELEPVDRVVDVLATRTVLADVRAQVEVVERLVWPASESPRHLGDR